jgi:hypothetical protein
MPVKWVGQIGKWQKIRSAVHWADIYIGGTMYTHVNKYENDKIKIKKK